MSQPVLTSPFQASTFGEASPAKIEEDGFSYKVSMVLRGISLREIYVIANPRSVLVEFRRKRVYCRSNGSTVTEYLDQRVSREFQFPGEILRGQTTVLIRHGVLEIIAKKSSLINRFNQKVQWSELV